MTGVGTNKTIFSAVSLREANAALIGQVKAGPAPRTESAYAAVAPPVKERIDSEKGVINSPASRAGVPNPACLIPPVVLLHVLDKALREQGRAIILVLLVAVVALP